MRKLVLLFMGVALVLTISCEGQIDTAAKYEATTLRAEEVWNTGELTIADEVFAPDFVNHDPSAPEVTDLASYKGFVAMVRSGMPDFHVTIDDMVTEGDEVAARWTASGTHRGEFLGIPPTGKHATWTGIAIYRFADGKIVEAWWSKDTLGLLQQIGVIPDREHSE